LPRAPADVEVTPVSAALFAVGDPLTPVVEPAPTKSAVQGVSFGTAVLLALLGGLLLNLMPCVLPILALKVVAVADLAHERRGTVLAHGAAYTAGVLVSMALLAIVVALLRLAGTSVGWGFQFQHPFFVASICTLLVVFAMNLFGAFEVTFQPRGPTAVPTIGPSAPRRSFFEGALAVVLATPCTAPFLGTAIGFAFASSTFVIFAIFLSVGLGLAAPYALVTLVPGWAPGCSSCARGSVSR
jgi:thiol:disulfide interchange protein DsbD